MTDTEPTEVDSDSDERNLTLDAVTSQTNTLYNDPSTYGTRADQLEDRHNIDDESSSDDVDVRKLFNAPTVDLIRWHYRENGMASTVVDKPVKDAFKHGFELQSEEDADIDPAESWLKDDYIGTLQDARMKARRDGLALVFWVINDAGSVETEVDDANDVLDIKIITLDNLAQGVGDPRHSNRNANEYASAQEAAENTKYDSEQLVVTKSGLVVVDDITSVDDGKFVGAMYERNPNITTGESHTFIHADRLQLFVERDTVDGDVNRAEYGHVEGDSVLTPILHALTGISKAEWALGQSLLRYSAPLHVIEIGTDVQPKDGDWETHIEEMGEQTDNITNKSSLVLPPDHEGKTLGSDGDIDPEPFLQGLINSICAGSEITRSVLLGTQAGTVSGSSTDIKNYYNQVQRYRHNEGEKKIRQAVDMAEEFGVFDESLPSEYECEWGPLFRIDDIERTDGMMKVVSAVSNAVDRYMLSHEQAQDVIEQEWARLDVDFDIESLSEDEMDQLDRINTQKGKQYGEGNSSEAEVEESRQSGNNGGGRSGGNTTDPNDPSTDTNE